MQAKEVRGPKQLQELMKSRERIKVWRGFSTAESKLETDYGVWLRTQYKRTRVALILLIILVLGTAPFYGRHLLDGDPALMEQGIFQMRLFEWLLALPACVLALLVIWRRPDSPLATRLFLFAGFAVFITATAIRYISARSGGDIPVELVMLVPLAFASAGGVRNYLMLPMIVLCFAISECIEISLHTGPPLARALLGVGVMTLLAIIAAVAVDRLTRRAWLDRSIIELSAMLDSVTGLPNRSWFNRDVALLMRQLQRLSAPVAVGLLDLDFFKKLNDSHGHAAGDEALAAVGQLLMREFARRPQDLVGRYGGEEFVVVFYDVTTANARLICERLVASIAALRIPNDNTPQGRLTASLGIWQGVPNKQQKIEDLLKAADEALYKAKGAGRNQYQMVQG